ncbi:MAG: MotA/TolQ/ExbB proton channel family protein [Planctomycetes bacterium]|nr:MotA/TolQ/ExbB proton channel family protein [Planctomycetota bacterium]
MDFFLSINLLAQLQAPVQRSYLSWMFSSLGPIYGLLIPLAGITVFLGACLVVAMSRRPAVIAAYLVFLPLPLLIGVFGSIQGLIASYAVIAASTTSPKPADVAAGVSTALFTVLIGLLVSFPSYFVLAVGLLMRTLAGNADQGR